MFLEGRQTYDLRQRHLGFYTKYVKEDIMSQKLDEQRFTLKINKSEHANSTLSNNMVLKRGIKI